MATSKDPSLPAAAQATAGQGEVVLAVDGLAKAFGRTQALRECSFSARSGDVHAVIGENGSGKSTLVKILAGVQRPDSGTLEIAGRSYDGVRSPRVTLDAGVVPVFQEVLVVGPQTVLENVWMGVDGLFRRRVAEDVKRERAATVLAELTGEAPPLDAPVETLPLSMRQVCGIARALVRDPRILILDESTSALDVATRDRLFAIVRRLTAQGGTVIFISHRMDEIEEIADRVTVLRSGRSVATVSRAEASAQELVRLMSGADHLTAGAERERTGPAASDREPVLEAGITLRPGAAPIEFTLKAGELVGLAGLEGHGQDAFLRSLWGGAGDGQVGAPPRRRVDPRRLDGAGRRPRGGLRPARSPLGVPLPDAVHPRELRRGDALAPTSAAGCCHARAPMGASRASGSSWRSRSRPQGCRSRRSAAATSRRSSWPGGWPWSRRSCSSTTRRAASTSTPSATSTGC